MIISLKWLKDYIDLDGISIEEIVDKLTITGLEVDEVIDQNKMFTNFVVGYVIENKIHPNADRLSVCLVSDGNENYNVVCGAPNVEVGQKVVFAKIGAIIPNGNIKLKAVKIRGESSFGMICAEDELGLSDDHTGIMILDSSLKEGTPISDALGLNDVILDIAVTPNRADAFCHIGVARDLSAIFYRPLKKPVLNLLEKDNDVNDFASIEILNPEDCPRYAAKVVTDINIKESPEWLKDKLKSIGLRPINNVVDVTNFILHELGQPLHAFDLDLLAQKKIVVQSANDNSKFVTLDSKERNMNSSDLMICDGEKPVAIAGVMGGENSEVTENTKNILIESAYFHPTSVRKTSKRLGLSTDSSYRFERGCNPEMTVFAANRAAQLIAELGNGSIAKGIIDVYPKFLVPRKISIRYNRIKKILGIEIPVEEVKNIFEYLEFNIIEENIDDLTVEVPYYRHDLEREVDLIEEVARIHGYDKIPIIENISITLEERVDQSYFNEDLRDILAGLGYHEIVTNSLLNEETANLFGEPIGVINPQSNEMSHLRDSLIPGSLRSISNNLKVKETNLIFFEIGNIFEKISSSDIRSFDDFIESEHLLLSVTGNTGENEWYDEGRKFDFYDLKGIVNEFFNKISLSEKLEDSFDKGQHPILEYSWKKAFEKMVLGIGGKVKKEILNYFDINQDVYVFDFNLNLLKSIVTESSKFRELLKYPKIIKDFAVILSKDTDTSDVLKTIKLSSTKLLKKAKLFDIFESESLGAGKKSLAFQLEYYQEDKTLREEDIEKEFWNTIDQVKSKHNAQLRGA